MGKVRILFVDDEQAVLDGLSRALYKDRPRWDLEFAAGGSIALEMLERSAFDVVVSDMRMPGMDGAALLAVVKERHPSAARILLTGGSNGSSVTRALPVAHQFLAKPCSVATLRATIERTCALQAMLFSAAMTELVRGIDTLPSVAAAYSALTDAARDPATTIERLADIVESDAAMAVRVLQLANSAYLDSLSPITSVRKAVDCLGVDRLRGLTLSSAAFATADSATLACGLSLETVQSCSTDVARLARLLVDDPSSADDAFTAGLVHDVGWIVFALRLGAQFAEIVRTAHATHRPIHVVEKEVLGTTHAEVGAYLLGTWGLPFGIVEAVAYHHDPTACARPDFGLVGAVHVADALVECVKAATDGENRLDAAYVAKLGLGHRVGEWRRIAAEVVRA